MNGAMGKWIATACLALWLCGCGASGRQSIQHDEPEARPSEPEVYYAGQDDLPLYSEPSFTGEPIARLPRNEKLLRSSLKGGFAFVAVERTGQTGWVENAKLTWRKKLLPTIAPTAPPSEPPPAESPPADAAANGQRPASDKPDASIFDSD